MVDKGTLYSVWNIFQGGELGLNLITHLGERTKEWRARQKLETVQMVTKQAPWVPEGWQTMATNTWSYRSPARKDRALRRTASRGAAASTPGDLLRLGENCERLSAALHGRAVCQRVWDQAGAPTALFLGPIRACTARAWDTPASATPHLTDEKAQEVSGGSSIGPLSPNAMF